MNINTMLKGIKAAKSEGAYLATVQTLTAEVKAKGPQLSLVTECGEKLTMSLTSEYGVREARSLLRALELEEFPEDLSSLTGAKFLLRVSKSDDGAFYTNIG